MRGRKSETVKKRDDKGRILPNNISQRKDGRYIFRMMADGKVYGPLYDWDLKRLKEKAEAIRVQVRMNEYLEPNTITVNQYFDKWMELYGSKNMKPQSAVNKRNYWKWCVMDKLGTKKLQKVRPADLVQHYTWLLEREEKPISWGTLKTVNSIISNMMDKAVQEDLLVKNPAYKILDSVEKKQKEKEKTALTESEQKRFIEYISNHRFYSYHKNLFTVLFGTGCRVGEVCALCSEDLYFDEGMFHIYKTLFYRDITGDGKRDTLIGSAKMARSTRTLPMLPKVREAFENQIERNRFTRMTCDKAIKSIKNVDDVFELEDSYSSFIFLNQNRMPYTPEYVTIIIKKICASYNREETKRAEEEGRKPELLPEFSAHITRHTFATRLAERGIPTSKITAWLGHKPEIELGVSRTTSRYVHYDNYKGLLDTVPLLEDMVIS